MAVPADSFRASLTLDACSAATVKMLLDTFAVNGPVAAVKAPTTHKQRSRLAPKTTAPRRKAAEPAVSAVPVKERYRIAVETINTSLKCLTEASKNPPPKPTVDEAPKPVKNRKPIATAARDARALQARSANSISQPVMASPLQSLAMCCSLSITHLQSLEGEWGAPEMQPLQCENARFSLASKLLLLQLHELALKELFILSGRLKSIMAKSGEKDSWIAEADRNSNVIRSSSTARGKSEKDQLCDSLKFGKITSTSAAFPLVLSCFLSIFRCVAGMKRVDFVEAIVPSFSTANHPISLLEELSRSTPSKALLHTSNLMQILTSLAPSCMTSTDDAALDPEQFCTPISALTLHTYAAECSVLRRTLQDGKGHSIGPWEWFTKHFSAYMRRSKSQTDQQARHLFARAMVARINRLPDCRGKIPLEIFKSMSQSAVDAGHIDDIAKWTSGYMQALKELGETTNEGLIVLCKVRLAALELRKLSSSTKDGIFDEDAVHAAEDVLQSAIDSLGSISRGRKQDFDSLLAESAQIRRPTLKIHALVLKSQENDGDSLGPTSTTLRKLCGNITGSVIQFCRKYMGMGLSEDDKTRLKSILLPSIDVVLSTCWRGFDINSTESWDGAESLLRECIHTLKAMEEDEIECDSTIYEKISNAYWQMYLLYKSADGHEKQSATALRRSVSSMEGRPIEELRNSSIAQKWERLGTIYMSGRDFNRAEDAYLQAMKMFSAIGTLEEFGSRASKGETLSRIIDSTDRVTAAVSRCITSLVKIAYRKKDDEEVAVLRFEYEGLSTSARGIVLEWAYFIARDLMEDDATVIRAVGERLLDAYDLEEFPVRFGRLVAQFLALAVDRAGLIDRQEVQSLGNDVLNWSKTGDLWEDQALAGYKNDVVASCLTTLALSYWQEGRMEPSIVRDALGLWNAVAKDVSDQTDLERRLNLPEETIGRLVMLEQFLEMKGQYELRICALKVLMDFRLAESPINCNELASVQTSLGLQCNRLGYSGKAGIALAKSHAVMKIEAGSISTITKLQWHLAYTEYLIGLGNVKKGTEVVSNAQELSENDAELQKGRRAGARQARRAEFNRLVADAAYVSSHLALEQGNLNEALLHARRCIRLNQRVWACLESLITTMPRSGFAVEGSDDASIQQAHSATNSSLNIPVLWPLVSRLCLAFIHTADVYRHIGMAREASYFAEQAFEIASAVNNSPLQGRIRLIMGDLKIRTGFHDEGEALLNLAMRDLREGGKDAVELDLAWANFAQLCEEPKAEKKAYERAQKKIEELVQVDAINRLGNLETEDESLASMLGGVKLEEPVKRPRTPTRGGRKTPRKAAPKPAPKKAIKSEPVMGECAPLFRLKGQVQRLKATYYALQFECELAVPLLEEADRLPSGPQETLQQGLSQAKQFLCQGLDLLSSDPIFSSIQESTISYPSVSLALGAVKAQLSPKPKKSRRPIPARSRTSQMHLQSFVGYLDKARDQLTSIHVTAMKMGSSVSARSIASLLAKVIVLRSAVISALGSSGPEHPLYASYSLDLNKAITDYRERVVVECELLSSTTAEDLRWPEITVPSAVINSSLMPFSFSKFQAEYIDIIPSAWTAVSISLSENREELYITRFQASRREMMVRIPLGRQTDTRDDADTFSFNKGIEAFRHIVETANASTHQAKNMKDKESRQQWWKRREELDLRLKDLLTNIEHCWLGGFRGILKQSPKYKPQFANFKKRFEGLLAQYLPSRKMKAMNGKRVALDDHVLELFTSLGDPKARGVRDMDEEYNDLIYFVVDILQFNGERNAYDEINMLHFIVDLNDALINYHDSCRLHPEHAEAAPTHTILILDKYVQCIPWESIPSLRSHSVSRLPSLSALRERILAMKPTIPSGTGFPAGHYLDPTSGTYILNPDSDLQSTQSMFADPLASLPGWDGITLRAPTEPEFKEALAEKDLFLYFGHGSGAHYINTRTIKRLDKCAVSCLMGCSSGALRDMGEFEPHGMVKNYLMAGAPAVLATLWDVTDRDVDRFTMETLTAWKLLEKKEEVMIVKEVEKKGRRKWGEISSDDEEEEEAPKSLVEAAKDARESCVLKYLNGAATVVYGIPAYFKPRA